MAVANLYFVQLLVSVDNKEINQALQYNLLNEYAHD